MTKMLSFYATHGLFIEKKRIFELDLIIAGDEKE
jgi:hypothetical protein